MQQNHSNHKRYVPAFHFVLSGIIVILLIGAIINIAHMMCACKNGACLPYGCWCFYDGLRPLLVALCLLLLFWYTRRFAVKAQDRAIHAEEGLRYFIITGKPLDPRLTWGQIIALRFAGDDEYISLTERAINENLKPNDIKKVIKNWRADNHRC